ncbi:DNA adenine methylase [Bradyrhizobium diazoefficiens]|uniref:DNA adenine methylase n=1 Tax=Bradyrhizobium diazoefficiens TaxID=1355477 RepID=UPI003836E6D2
MSNVVALKRSNESGVLGATETDISFTRAQSYPELRYMGSKKRLLPWIGQVLSTIDFESALDPFSGTGSVGYLIKSMERRVVASDFLNFPSLIARATIENNSRQLDGSHVKTLLSARKSNPSFIERTFQGIFYTADDLKFLDRVSANIRRLDHPHLQALAYAALFRSCLKRQPRGVFTVSGDLSRYDDGRRDLRLSIEEHFIEQIEVFNQAVFHNGRRNKALRCDVFEAPSRGLDLVYLDPPYVPRSDDNCYIKRYHFIEGLASYWKGLPVDMSTKVRKIEKKFTPFSYRKAAIEAFDRLFSRFSKSIIVLSYSSNGFPDLEHLEALMRRYKKSVRVFERPHRYHFGTHENVERSKVTEYLIVGQ